MQTFRRFYLRVLLIFLCELLSSACSSPSGLAQLPTFELHALSQSAAQIGSTVELQLTGTHSEELQSLQFSCPDISAESAIEPAGLANPIAVGSGSFRVKISASAPAGPCEVRGVGRFGLSNPRRLWLTRKPLRVVNLDHSRAAVAVELDTDAILLARCQPQQRNFYRMHLDTGQSLHLVVYARQLDSRATPIVVIQNDAAEELARGRARGGWPAEATYCATGPMEITIIVHDAIYQGGHEYGYALECGISSSSSARPSDGSPGGDPQSDPIAELELDSLLRPTMALQAANQVSIELVTSRSDRASSPGPGGSASPELHVQGVFAEDRSPGIHEFDANRDQQLTLEITSHSAGQLTDPRLLLYRVLSATEVSPLPAGKTPPPTTGQLLLEQDDPPAVGSPDLQVSVRDPSVTWTAPESARYRLELQDNESGSRTAEQRQYTLDIRPPRPDFALLSYPAFPTNQPGLSRPVETNLLRGGTAALRVLAFRRDGYAGPIEVTLRGLPPGVTTSPVTIHPTQSQATVILACDETATSWSGAIEVVGTAPDVGTRVAQAATICWPAIATHNAVQSRLCANLMLGVNSLDLSPLSVALGGGDVLDVKPGDKLAIPIRVTRRAGGAAACTLRAQNLLSKVTASEVAFAADQTDGQCELTIAADAPLGEFSLWLQAETKIKWRENPQALQRAEEQLAQLNAALPQATDAAKQAELMEAIKLLTTQVQELKTSTAEKELTVFLPSSSQRVRIVAP